MKLALQFPNKLISFLHVSQGAYDTVKLDSSLLTQFITKLSRDIIKRLLPIKIKVLQNVLGQVLLTTSASSSDKYLTTVEIMSSKSQT